MVTALVLAAGVSRRAGTVNKLLSRDRDGRCMIVRSVTAACRSQAARVIVVLGHDHLAVAAALDQAGLTREARLRLTETRDYTAGLSASLRQAVSCAAAEGAEGVMVCLGDMPLVRSSTLDHLMARMCGDASAQACVPMMDRQRGNPVLWRRTQFDALLALDGDKGARALLDGHGRRVLEVAVDDPGVLADFDTPEQIARYATSQETPSP